MPTARPSSSEPRTLLTHPELKSQQSIPAFKSLGEAPKSALERLLSVFADVRAGEGIGALLLAVNVFMILAAYNVLKPARDGLALAEGGAVGKAASAGAQAAVLMAVIPLYGWVASRVPRFRLLVITSLFFASNLVIFYLAGQAGMRVGAAFYVWMGVFNVFVVSQIWAFANDIYTEGQGRRLFAMIGVGASLGAWVGAVSVGPLVKSLGFTPYSIMLLGGVALLVSLGVTTLVNLNARHRAKTDADLARDDRQPLERTGGFELIFKERYLLWIALLFVLLNAVNTTGNFLLDKFVESEAFKQFGAGADQADSRKLWMTTFSGSIIQTVNLVGFLVQLFVTSRVFRFMGVRGAMFILPVLALGGYSVIAVAPILAVVRVGKILENATDYSIQNTVRQALFLPTSREAKYKAKAAVDTFFTRTGDLISAGLVVGGSAMAFGIGTFAWINVGLTVAWLWVAGQIAREHRRRTL